MRPFDNILIAGADDFVAPYIYRAAKERLGKESNVWMLGTGELAGIKANLAESTFQPPVPMDLVILVDGSDSTHFIDKTALKSAHNLLDSLSTTLPAAFVYISTTEVYGLQEGEEITEEADLNPITSFGKTKLAVEKLLADYCSNRDVKLAILRPAPIVGTGMGGDLRCTVNRIWRGTYRHIDRDNSCLSVVHATDVARAAVMIAGHQGTFNVTDGVNPTHHDLTEALCSRLDRKRIYTLPLRKLRILARIGDYLPVTGYNTGLLKRQLSTLTFDSSRLATELPGFKPSSVTEYLTTHVYDTESL